MGRLAPKAGKDMEAVEVVAEWVDTVEGHCCLPPRYLRWRDHCRWMPEVTSVMSDPMEMVAGIASVEGVAVEAVLGAC